MQLVSSRTLLRAALLVGVGLGLAVALLHGVRRWPRPAGTTEAQLRETAGAIRPDVSDLVQLRPVQDVDAPPTVVPDAALRARPDQLSEADVASLLAFLRNPGLPADWNWERLRAGKNNAMDLLESASPAPPAWLETLIQMARDARHDLIVREYAVQHIASWYKRAPQRAEVVGALLDLADGPEPGLAATALVGLCHLAEAAPAIPPAAIRRRALAWTAPEAAPLAQMTAFQVCARLGAGEARIPVETAARRAGPLSLRVSAISALGTLGAISSRETLLGLAADSQPEIRKAAAAALLSLDERLRTLSRGT